MDSERTKRSTVSCVSEIKARQRRKGAPLPGRPPRKPFTRLAAAQVTVAAAVDLAADRSTRGGAEDGAEQARTAVVDRIADQSADSGADDETGRAVVAAAIITAVTPAIDAVVVAQPALAIVAAVAIIIVGIIIAARAGPVPIVAVVGPPVAVAGLGSARARIRGARDYIRGGYRPGAARGGTRAPPGARYSRDVVHPQAPARSPSALRRLPRRRQESAYACHHSL